MRKVEIPTDPFDLKFREHIASEIRKAKKSIKIVTGEIGSYNYFDLRSAAEDAAKRGVDIHVYSVTPERDITNRLIHNKINVYRGNQDPKEHFIIRDDKAVTISFKDEGRIKPTPMGKRKAKYTEDPKVVSDSLQIFKKLMQRATKVKISGRDPLEEALEKPVI
jgi:hypothetical protein